MLVVPANADVPREAIHDLRAMLAGVRRIRDDVIFFWFLGSCATHKTKQRHWMTSFAVE